MRQVMPSGPRPDGRAWVPAAEGSYCLNCRNHRLVRILECGSKRGTRAMPLWIGAFRNAFPSRVSRFETKAPSSRGTTVPRSAGAVQRQSKRLRISGQPEKLIYLSTLQ